MMTGFQRFIFAIRYAWASLMSIVWMVAALCTGCAMIDALGSKSQGPGDGVMVVVVTIYFIMPLALVIPGVIGFVIWAPVDFLLGVISGMYALLPWQKTDDDDD